MAEWGTIAASCGREPIAGSGVLPGGELASGDVTVLGFSCKHTEVEWCFSTQNQNTDGRMQEASSLRCSLFSLMMLIDLLTSGAEAVMLGQWKPPQCVLLRLTGLWSLVLECCTEQEGRSALIRLPAA